MQYTGEIHMAPATETALIAIGLGAYLFVIPGYLGWTHDLDDEAKHSVDVHGKRKVRRGFMALGIFLVLVGIAMMVLY